MQVGDTGMLLFNLTPPKAGLVTVGYAIKDPNGAVTTAPTHARTTTGLVDLGQGYYGVPFVAPATPWWGYAEADSGDGSPVYDKVDVYVSDGLAALRAPVPASYASGTLGAVVGQLVPGMQVTYVAPLTIGGGDINLVAGDDYYAADARSLDWFDVSGTAWPTLTSATVALVVTATGGGTSWQQAATVVTPTGANKHVRVELSAAQTVALTAGRGKYTYVLLATLSSGHRATLAHGGLVVQ